MNIYKAVADYRSADNRRLTIGRLLINTKKNYFAVLFKLFIKAPIVIRGLLLTWKTADQPSL